MTTVIYWSCLSGSEDAPELVSFLQIFPSPNHIANLAGKQSLGKFGHLTNALPVTYKEERSSNWYSNPRQSLRKSHLPTGTKVSNFTNGWFASWCEAPTRKVIPVTSYYKPQTFLTSSVFDWLLMLLLIAA